VPEDEIGLVAPFEGADLIVMATHSRSGLDQLIKGSVANRVLQLASVPVVLVHPAPGSETQPLSKTLAQPSSLAGPANQIKLVVTLDGSLGAEVALEPAFHLAKGVGATLYLVRVVSSAEDAVLRSKQNFLKEGEIAGQDHIQREAASQYLQNFQFQLLSQGVNCVKAVLWGEPAVEIVDYAHKVKASMLVMASHIRGRIGQFFLGSVTGEVISHSQLPVLMVAIGLPNQN
jgi:nucleotide-binding universal stress UspA family protein